MSKSLTVESLIGFKYTDVLHRMITVISKDPVKGPGYYLVERDDGAQWGVKAEMLESVSPYEAWCIEQGIEPKENEHA